MTMIHRNIPATAAIKLPIPIIDNLSWKPGKKEVLACINEDGQSVKIFDLEEPETTAAEIKSNLRHLNWEDDYEYGSIEWSASGNLLAISNHGGGIKLWNSNGARVRELLSRSDNFLQIRFNENDKLVVVFNEFDKSFEVFDLDTGACLQEVMQDKRIDEIIWKDGQEFFTNSEGTINIWRVGQHIPFKTIHINIPYSAMAWDPWSGVLASGSQEEGSIQLWRLDLANPTVHASLSGHREYVQELVWSPGKSGILASWDYGGAIIIWDTVSGTSLHTIAYNTEDEICNFSFSPDGLLFACAGEVKEVWVWKTETWELAAVCEVEGEHVSWSPHGDKLAIKTEIGNVFIFNMKMTSLKTLAVMQVASCLKNQLDRGQEKEDVLKVLEIPVKLKPYIGLYL